MAKLGEGDPRWIVEQRADGSNVNQWHWTEKDVTQWVKTRVRELLQNQVILEKRAMMIRTTILDKVDGEANLYNRKGKVWVWVSPFSVTLGARSELSSLVPTKGHSTGVLTRGWW